ncbi:isoprenoid biosynthesis glyoxalase ElbB [Erwiniaceae bacterium BAC15a-03b]|uniref:Glyoxalase n=1 Tax=Winslowiella arboricola TaxID=2978220 RepID=A0A9J6PRT5_9GAMM|nr:isoprenoid biosynthesis glyoxalase ElbB [Winslowiella arboricola]MCU5773443.1 isoprenoid biosynthesis glyoxalase ElbB [Winslowiella arboricola]MCU5776767.1 isoprenoid biosynthesis glyoxalase ElbB [Winslowiella arboricola]
MKCIGVILSGCGVFDGSEIYETVLTLLAIERAGAKAICFAPDKSQLHVINHITGEEMAENRNVLVESARIVRGEILSLDQADSVQLDALIVPGGFGAAKNLSSFASEGEKCNIDENLQKLTYEIYKQRKPIGFICISPALIPRLLDAPVRVTVGTDSNCAEVIEAMGGIHVSCPVDDIVVDEEHRVVTTPAFMLANSIDEAASGIDKLVKRVVDMIA